MKRENKNIKTPLSWIQDLRKLGDNEKWAKLSGSKDPKPKR